jgi:hypothetical protein
MARLLLKNSDRKRYGPLLCDIENQFTRGQDQYPATLTSAYEYLVNYVAARPGRHVDEGGMSYYQDDETPVQIGHHQQDVAEEDVDVRAIRSVAVVDAGEVTVVDEEPKVVKDRLNVRLAMHLRMTTTHMCRMHWTMTTMKTGPSS